MPTVLLEDYKPVKTTNDRQKVLKERAQILETVARKAQEKTLTLQETTDLYAKFNSTYERNYASQVKRSDDESWALKLIKECEEDTPKDSSFETRINGIPVAIQKAKTQKPNLSEIRAINQNVYANDDFKSVSNKTNLSADFIFNQLSQNRGTRNSQVAKKSQRSLIRVIAISVAITVTALLGNAFFLSL
tara:strand:- start:1303 stop:1872 length:570 start_codon:yes stop_codon:yes gene_type:complete